MKNIFFVDIHFFLVWGRGRGEMVRLLGRGLDRVTQMIGPPNFPLQTADGTSASNTRSLLPGSGEQPTRLNIS